MCYNLLDGEVVKPVVCQLRAWKEATQEFVSLRLIHSLG